MTSLESLLLERLGTAFQSVVGHHVDPVLRRSAHADFQAARCRPPRKLGRPPRDIAADVLAAADLSPSADTATVSVPGYINITLSATALGGLLAEMAADDRLGVPLAASPETVVVDYSAPNVANEMHVGHPRSTFVGDAAARLLALLGHDVRRANHVGDWVPPSGCSSSICSTSVRRRPPTSCPLATSTGSTGLPGSSSTRMRTSRSGLGCGW